MSRKKQIWAIIGISVAIVAAGQSLPHINVAILKQSLLWVAYVVGMFLPSLIVASLLSWFFLKQWGTKFRDLQEPWNATLIFCACIITTVAALILARNVQIAGLRGGAYVIGDVALVLLATTMVYCVVAWHRSRKSQRAKRAIYYASALMLALFVSLFIDDVDRISGLDRYWYNQMVALRGDRIPQHDSVAVFSFAEGWPPVEEFIDVVATLQKSEPAVVVLPPGVPERYFATADLPKRMATELTKTPILLTMDSPPNTGWNTVARGASTIERTAFGDVTPSLTNQDGYPMYCRPLDAWNKDIAVAAVEIKRGQDRSIPQGRLDLPASAVRNGRMLINHYTTNITIHAMPWVIAGYLSTLQVTEGKLSPVLYLGNRVLVFDPARRELFDPADQRKSKPEKVPEFRDKIVFIHIAPTKGSSSTAVTPWRYETHLNATIAENILNNDFLTEPERRDQILAAFLLLVILVGIFRVSAPWKALALSLLAVAGVILFYGYCFLAFGLFMSISWIVIGSVISGGTVFTYEVVAERSGLLQERTKLQTELQTAHDMQMSLMPREDPAVGGYDISGICRPASEVGGDYYDYVWLDGKKSKLGIAVADVSGKAMKAAITAVMTSGMIYREIGSNNSPKSILTRINRPMFLKTDRRVFTALLFAVIDTKKRTLRVSNAGQTQPMLHRNGKITYIRVKGKRLPLGIEEDSQYGETLVRLTKGDVLVFYTDGLPEATNAKQELLGFERVEQEVKDLVSFPAAQIVRGLTALVERHTGKAEQHDDMTVVVVKVL